MSDLAQSTKAKFPQVDYSGLPEHMQDGALFYVEHGIEPGSFMSAVICNDLSEACARADDINRYRLFDIVSWFYNEAPGGCWGSREKMAAWIVARSQDDSEAPSPPRANAMNRKPEMNAPQSDEPRVKPATALPWDWDSQRTYDGDNYPYIPECSFIAGLIGLTGNYEGDSQDCAYVKHACNAYPKLVAALRDVLTWYASPVNGGFGVAAHSTEVIAADLLRELGELK